MTTEADERMFAPATARNLEPIFDVLQRLLPAQGTVLEIASGSGEHGHAFAPRLPHLIWQPSDRDPETLASIEAWRKHGGASNLRPPLNINTGSDQTGDPALPDDVGAVFCCNMIHISPWRSCRGLMRLAGGALNSGGVLAIYGPFRVDGEPWAASNEKFDRWLKDQDPAWGVRNLAEVVACASGHDLMFEETVAMPANNMMVVFRKVD